MSNTPSLPCPFCGGINIIHCGHHMYCHACGADGPDADSQHESEAIAAWNRRTPQPAPAPLSDDVVQKTWALIDELEKLRGADRYEEDWDTLNKRDSELRAALAAQGEKDVG